MSAIVLMTWIVLQVMIIEACSAAYFLEEEATEPWREPTVILQ
jgi:hypothetical protein